MLLVAALATYRLSAVPSQAVLINTYDAPAVLIDNYNAPAVIPQQPCGELDWWSDGILDGQEATAAVVKLSHAAELSPPAEPAGALTALVRAVWVAAAAAGPTVEAEAPDQHSPESLRRRRRARRRAPGQRTRHGRRASIPAGSETGRIRTDPPPTIHRPLRQRRLPPPLGRHGSAPSRIAPAASMSTRSRSAPIRRARRSTPRSPSPWPRPLINTRRHSWALPPAADCASRPTRSARASRKASGKKVGSTPSATSPPRCSPCTSSLSLTARTMPTSAPSGGRCWPTSGPSASVSSAAVSCSSWSWFTADSNSASCAQRRRKELAMRAEAERLVARAAGLGGARDLGPERGALANRGFGGWWRSRFRVLYMIIVACVVIAGVLSAALQTMGGDMPDLPFAFNLAILFPAFLILDAAAAGSISPVLLRRPCCRCSPWRPWRSGISIRCPRSASPWPASTRSAV